MRSPAQPNLDASVVAFWRPSLPVCPQYWAKFRVITSFLELTSYLNTGEAVDVEDEVVIVNSIVLPNKTLNVSVQEEIIL
ncbi:Mannose-1-phosphate guanylyltransferase 1 [Zea mays]|uniref:Mannose-1-phosphate guanylyltransferase 1 n=1 Tax=Zea mays TaxID=4577 RepID=A0A1D6JRL0_MAIZE|nr:Mannose-1-phosphate guanylyltransferase 1 [Zea mays]